ncbi:MAG: HDOD domain-containing protein, partial [Desulfobacterales bacterium]|nr:HDOD domain-containing protein [Desulfobacterales bacterium]
MNLVSVFTAKPGMVLARDVKNKDGRHLMDAGTTLGKKEIRILKMWGIPEVMVRPAKRTPQKTKDAGNAKLEAFLKRWFRQNSLKDPMAEAIYNIVENWFSEHPEVLSAFKLRLRAAGGSRAGKPAGGAVDPSSLLNGEISLPALPQIYSEINAAVNDPKCSGKDIADIVSKDTSLSATLLKIVNSAFYGNSEKIDSLTLAAMTLGTREVCNLALGITVINYFKGMPETALDMEAFWRHSVGCGIMARNLATHIPEVNGERVFIGGLLHDIGRLV